MALEVGREKALASAAGHMTSKQALGGQGCRVTPGQ